MIENESELTSTVVGLVGIVVTVILAIAVQIHGNASAIAALEFPFRIAGVEVSARSPVSACKVKKNAIFFSKSRITF